MSNYFDASAIFTADEDPYLWLKEDPDEIREDDGDWRDGFEAMLDEEETDYDYEYDD